MKKLNCFIDGDSLCILCGGNGMKKLILLAGLLLIAGCTNDIDEIKVFNNVSGIDAEIMCAELCIEINGNADPLGFFKDACDEYEVICDDDKCVCKIY